MLSRRQRGLSLAVLLCALSVSTAAQGPTASADGPAASVCLEIRNEIDHYYTLWREGGTPRQMEVWRKLYTKNIWRFGNAGCPRYMPKRKKALAGTPDDVKPAVLTGPAADAGERQQAL